MSELVGSKPTAIIVDEHKPNAGDLLRAMDTLAAMQASKLIIARPDSELQLTVEKNVSDERVSKFYGNMPKCGGAREMARRAKLAAKSSPAS